MEKTFLTVLEISAGCAGVILIISLLSTIINRRFTAKWKYFIWLIIAVRLLVPFNPNFDIGQPKLEVSIPNASVVVPITQTPPAEEQPPKLPPYISEGEDPVVPVSPTLPDEKPLADVSLVQVLGCLWLVGTVVFLGIHIGSYVVFKKKLFRWARPLSRESRIFRTKEMLQNELGISVEVPVLICTDVTSPMMIGFFKSFLILPHENYSDTELYFILRHELTHFKRRDIWYKLLMTFANAVHWFNPAVWLMVRESNRDLEISCDSSVVRGADAQSRKLYSEAILANIRQQPKTTVFSTYFYDGKKSLKERFRNILSTQKRKKGLICFVTVVLCIGLIGGAVSCSLADSPQISSDNSSDVGGSNLFALTSFKENKRFADWMKAYFPNINDWRVLYEYHTYATEDNLRENGLYEWNDYSRYHMYFSVLATEQSDEFDRVLIVYADEFVLTKTEDGVQTVAPAKTGNSYTVPMMSVYRGNESNWKVGDCKGVEIVWMPNTRACTLWFPKQQRALFFGDLSYDVELIVENLTEKPSVRYYSYAPSFTKIYPEFKDDRLVYLYKPNKNGPSPQFDVGYYSYKERKLVFVEESNISNYGLDMALLGDSVFAIQGESRVSFYNVDELSKGKPFKILGGNGYGLSDSEIRVANDIDTDATKPSRHCIMYYVKDERKWRICTFDNNGNILSDFSTGIDVNGDYIEITHTSGLVYFKVQSSTYCVDARPDKNHTLQIVE